MSTMGQTFSTRLDSRDGNPRLNSQPPSKRRRLNSPSNTSHGHPVIISHQSRSFTQSSRSKHWRSDDQTSHNSTTKKNGTQRREVSESKEHNEWLSSVTRATSFKIDQVQVESRTGSLTLPPGGIPARMFLAIFSAARANSEGKDVEMFRDSQLCYLKKTSDQKMEVCLEEPFLIPAKKLYVKQKLGDSETDITFGFSETITQTWLETVDYQDIWPLMGSGDEASEQMTNEDQNLNGAILMCRSNYLLIPKCHSLDLTVRLPGKSFATLLCLTFITQNLSSLVNAPEKSASKAKERSISFNPSVTLEPNGVNTFSQQKRLASRNGKTLDLQKNGNSQEETFCIIYSDSDEHGDSHHIKDQDAMNLDDEEIGTLGRTPRKSRNLKPTYDARRHFKQQFSTVRAVRSVRGEKSPARFSLRKRTRRTTSEADEDERIFKDGPSRISPRKRLRRNLSNARQREDQQEEEIVEHLQLSPKKSGTVRVPKSHRPLYALTNRRMLMVGDELRSSDDEPDNGWLLEREVYAINDFIDVTDEEKEFCIMWNSWTIKPGNGSYSGTHLHENLIRFCAENRAWFLEKRSRLAEMCKLWEVTRNRVKEVTMDTWLECLKILELDTVLGAQR